MKAVVRKLLRERSTEFYVAGVLLWLLPGLILGILGLLYLWEAGWFWWFSGALLLLSLVSWAVRRSLAKSTVVDNESLQHMDPRPEWSDHDREVWRKSTVRIEEAGLASTPWEDIPQAMYDHLAYVARVYHGNRKDAEYAFSLPELLLMLETWSREYRAQVVENLPFAHEMKISTLKSASRRADSAMRIYSYISPFVSALRIGINPVTGLAREFSSQLASKYMGDLGRLMQKNIRVVLFEQVTQVGIDLYSGRLRLSEDELQAWRSAQPKPEEVDIKPLLVYIVGQVNSGKSSLVNALQEMSVAETDSLPATSGFHFHPMRLANGVDVYLVDSPGFDGDDDTMRKLARETVKADLLLWVSQANQPAKDLDRRFHEQWNAYFAENLARKKPPILLVTTHNDKLPPAHQWQPPYDLADTDDRKAAAMMAALEYSHEAIGLPEQSRAVPVSLLPGEDSFNLGVVQALLVAMSDEARSAQLNRQRLDAGTGKARMMKTFHQAAGLVKVGTKLVRK